MYKFKLPHTSCSLYAVRIKNSKLISRSFFKTEWMKPKFDVNNPYTTSRVKIPRIIDVQNVPGEENVRQSALKKAEEIVSEHATVECTRASYSIVDIPKKKRARTSVVDIPKCCHINKQAPSNFSSLNIERTLMPPMASLSCVLVRYYATDKRGKKADVFWKPKAKIPDSNEMVIRLRDPRTKQAALNEAKYLLLDFGTKPKYVKKKNLNPNPDHQSNPPHPQQSAMSEF